MTKRTSFLCENNRGMLLWEILTGYYSTWYSKTNVMHILFNLLRIKGLYMFRALLAHLQEAIHKRHQDGAAN
jgi:hypothetical protein